MTSTRIFIYVATLATALAFPVMAQAEYSKITTENEFVQVVKDKDLTLFGIKLQVSPKGRIDGRAYGSEVTGQWRWQDGYFCRDLYWGGVDLGPNCQEVRIKGDKIRFTSDRGTGRFADLTLR